MLYVIIGVSIIVIIIVIILVVVFTRRNLQVVEVSPLNNPPPPSTESTTISPISPDFLFGVNQHSTETSSPSSTHLSTESPSSTHLSTESSPSSTHLSTESPSSTHSKYLPSSNNSGTIFISIISYRDDQCPLTLHDLYKQADHPENIYVGIIQQNDQDDVDCWKDDINIPPNNIRMRRYNSVQARGPAMARFWATELYNNEDYFFQIDSHMRFLPHWDTSLIKFYHLYTIQLKTPKIVLSHYPLSYNVETNNFSSNHSETTTKSCHNFFNSDGIIQPRYIIVPSIDIHQSPIPYYQNAIIGAQMFFTRGQVLKDVPYDPDLPYLFHGEELLYSVRLWCQGYIILSPPQNFIFHYYGRETKPKIWSDHSQYGQLNREITNKVKEALLLTPEPYQIPPLTLTPPKECVREYYQYFQVDTVNKKINKEC